MNFLNAYKYLQVIQSSLDRSAHVKSKRVDRIARGARQVHQHVSLTDLRSEKPFVVAIYKKGCQRNKNKWFQNPTKFLTLEPCLAERVVERLLVVVHCHSSQVPPDGCGGFSPRMVRVGVDRGALPIGEGRAPARPIGAECIGPGAAVPVRPVLDVIKQAYVGVKHCDRTER